jgi:hypothetical protein
VGIAAHRRRLRTLVRHLYLPDIVALLKIVPSTQKLNIVRRERGAPFAIRNDVIKVQLIAGTADYALAPISSPDLEFHVGGDDPRILWRNSGNSTHIYFALNSGQSEFEHHSSSIRFLPGIQQMEETIV